MGPEPAYTLASAGILLNLADAVPEAEDDFLPAAWDAATLKGTDLEEGTYGFPWYLNSGPTFYNKAVLEECGITVDPNDPPTKQDDIFAMADTFGSNCGGKYALTSGIPSIQDFGMYGVELMNKDHTEFTFNNAKGVEFVQHYIDMYNAGAFTDDMLNSSTSGESKSFNGGTQAFMNGNAYSVDDIRKNAPKVFENLAITDFIANTKPNMFMEMLTVNATSKHQEEAIKFARFVTNSDNQLAFDKKANVFPSSKGTIDDKFFNPSDDTMDAEAMRMSADQIRNGEIWGPAQFTSACSTMLREEIAHKIAVARAEGDLSENGGYHGRPRGAEQEQGRITELTVKLRDSKIIENAPEGTVGNGSVVTIELNGNEMTYVLGSRDIVAGTDYEIMTPDSPIGKAIEGVNYTCGKCFLDRCVVGISSVATLVKSYT